MALHAYNFVLTRQYLNISKRPLLFEYASYYYYYYYLMGDSEIITSCNKKTWKLTRGAIWWT